MNTRANNKFDMTLKALLFKNYFWCIFVPIAIPR